MACIESLSKELKQAFPSIDDDLQSYVEGELIHEISVNLIEINFSGVLSSGDDFETSDEIFEAVGDILREVAEDKTDDDIRSLCDKFHSILMEESGANSKKNRKILDAPIQLNQMSTNMENDVENMTSIWIQGRNDTLVSFNQ